jgi:hypothetical protein
MTLHIAIPPSIAREGARGWVVNTVLKASQCFTVQIVQSMEKG